MPFIGRDGTTAFLPATVNTSSSLTVSGEGDLIVDTNTLFVDSSANKVGIGTVSPTSIFDVEAAAGAGINFSSSGNTAPTINFMAGGSRLESAAQILVGENNGGGDFIISTKNTGGTLTTRVTINNAGSVKLPDNGMFVAGADDDLQIYHNGSQSRLSVEAGGALMIRNKVADQDIIISTDDGSGGGNIANYFRADGSTGEVKLYHYGSEKLTTKSTGVSVTGNIDVSNHINLSGDLDMGDDDKLKLGAGDDLQIYHNGTTLHNFIVGSADLYVRGANILLQDQVNSNRNWLIGLANGTLELYHAGNKRIETQANGAKVTGILDVTSDFKVGGASNILVGGTALPSLTGLLGGSLSGTLSSVTMAYLAAAPSSPVQGQFYFNSLSSKAQIYTGSSFVDLVPSGGGGGGGGGSSTDAQATFRKYTYSVSSATSAISGAADGVTDAGAFVTGRKYQIKTVGNTDFTAVGSGNNNVGTIFTATGAGSGTGDAYDVLVYVTSGSQNVEVYVNGVKSVEGASNDYVATSGTSVNFVANLASGDVVDVLVYELLTNDAFVLAAGGTFTGNVGINTTSISNRLHIHSNANEQGILLTQAGNNYSVIYSDANRTGTTSHLLAIEGHWNGTPVAEIALQTGSDLTNKDDGQIIFRTASAGNLTNSDRMCIASDGKIGINNNAPLYPLHFKTAMSSSPSFIHMEVTGNNTVGGGGGIAFDTSASNDQPNNTNILYLATISGVRNSADDGSNDLVFKTSKSGVAGDDGNTHSPKEKLRITSDGRVNIGQASDVDHTLCVAGTDNTTGLTGGHSQGIQLQNKSTTDSTYSQIEWRTAAGGRYARIAGIQDDANGNGGQLVFLTETSGGTTTERLRITSSGAIKLNDNNIEPTGAGGNVSTAYNNVGWEKIVFDASYNTSPIGPNKIILQNDTGGGGWYAGFGIASNELSIYSGGQTTFYQGFNTAGAINESLRIDPNGRILVGPGAIATPKCGYAGIDIPNNDWAIIMGGSDGNGNRANNANKDGRFAGAHYVNAEEPIGIIRCSSGATASELHMGGGTSLVNAATQISLYTAANTTTTGGTERLRIDSSGRIKIGPIANQSSTTTHCPVYIDVHTDITAFNTAEGAANTGLVRIEETGSNTNRYHGIEFRNRQSGDIRIMNLDVNTSDRGDLVIAMPDQEASTGLHFKARFNSLKSSLQIAGKGGATLSNSATEHVDVYIATKSGLTTISAGAGAEVAGVIRFEDKGSNNNRYHGLELRNRNSGDVRIFNHDVGVTNKADMVFGVDDGSSLIEALRIHHNGHISQGTVAPPSSAEFTIRGANPELSLYATANYSSFLMMGDTNDYADGYIEYDNYSVSKGFKFITNNNHRMGLDSDGTLTVGASNYSFGSVGARISQVSDSHFCRANGNVIAIRRNSSDGQFIDFYRDSTHVGDIKVASGQVSITGAHLSRWTQLPGGAERTEILRGSVLTNLDEMCEWSTEAQEAVLYTEEDELPRGVSVGDVKTPALEANTEDNEQLNRMKISDVEGDPNVSGVFEAWDNDDKVYKNDFYCAMSGDLVIRIAQGVTVARGDLLMSAGDGTAKPQDDDIIRSKTIAKVTSTYVALTHPDGSYCVPCVLMAC